MISSFNLTMPFSQKSWGYRDLHKSHLQFWVKAALLVILTTLDASEELFTKSFFPSHLPLGSHIFLAGFHSLFANLPIPLASSRLLNFDLTLPTSSESYCFVSSFPVTVWLLFSPPFFTSNSLHALRLGTGQSFNSVFIEFKSFSPKQIFAYGNQTFAIWFFLLPRQRNSQFHIYFGKLSFPQMVSLKHQSKVRVYAFLQRFWAEVRSTHVFLLPSAVISSVHLIMGHNLTLFFFFLS